MLGSILRAELTALPNHSDAPGVDRNDPLRGDGNNQPEGWSCTRWETISYMELGIATTRVFPVLGRRTGSKPAVTWLTVRRIVMVWPSRSTSDARKPAISPQRIPQGRSSANPASEGAIRAEESCLIKTVERVNTAAGAAWGWALGIAMRIISKTWEDGSVDVVWQNPATPTEAQQADRLQKLTGGKPVMSVRGAMEELPWSALRKQKEMEWLGEEADQELGYAAMDEPGDPYVTGADERGQYN